MEKVLVLIKPDAMDKKIMGEIITMYEKKGLDITAIKIVEPELEVVKEHYIEHVEKPFYNELCNSMLVRSICAMIVEGDNVIAKVRKLHGATDPLLAESGTIRAMYAADKSHTCVHASDSPQSANREIKVWFPELVD